MLTQENELNYLCSYAAKNKAKQKAYCLTLYLETVNHW